MFIGSRPSSSAGLPDTFYYRIRNNFVNAKFSFTWLGFPQGRASLGQESFSSAHGLDVSFL